MKAFTPGHTYSLQSYAAKEGEPQSEVSLDRIQFMKRVGPGYPGNRGAPVDGTNCQEVLRVLIDRIKHLNGQINDLDNTMNLQNLRAILYRFERRAASR